MKIKIYLNLVILLTLGIFLVELAWADDYVLSGESAELEPGQTFDNFTLTNGATLTTYGVLRVLGKFTMDSNSKLLVKTFDETINGTGTLTVYTSDILITEGSIISADEAGNDGRGFLEREAGAGYGGEGGNGGPTYGSPGGDGVFMGSASDDAMGGGAISLICQWLYVDGSSKITANGEDGDRGGGSGGGILINADAIHLLGSLDASGGYAGYGGGGGRIKIHYFTKQIGDENQITAKGDDGVWSGGKDGTIWYNRCPDPPSLLAPADGATVSSRPVFQFSAVDHSDEYDGREKPDQVRFRIELSQDNFQTILYNIDQSARYVRGWVDDAGVMKLWHDSGAEATYQMQEDIPEGTYQWRVFANDGKESEPSEIQTFTVAGATPVTIEQVAPDIGAAGQPVTLTGKGFVNGTTITFGEIPSQNISVVSSTQITLTVPAGNTGWVDIYVQAPDGSSATLPKAFRYIDLSSYTARMELTRGINIISLPLNPDKPYSASSLSKLLGATIVLRAENGNFQVYVDEGGYGIDFPIEMGKGYIINLLEAKPFELKGKPWGIPSAPSARPAEPWAFVVTGRIMGTPPAGATVRIANARAEQTIRVPIQSNGDFVGAFVDMRQRAVVASGDTLTLELIDAHEQLLSKPQYPCLTSTNIERAHLHTTLAAKPQATKLLPNFPNPFNPETWIPYTLAEASEVKIHIYDAKGHSIRSFSLGYKPAGWYGARSSAVHWDGRNDVGERVVSGLFFVEFRAETHQDVSRMLVAK